MAATLASVCSVPLTSVLLLFELTKDYRILLPLMVSTVIHLIKYFCLFIQFGLITIYKKLMHAPFSSPALASSTSNSY